MAAIHVVEHDGREPFPRALCGRLMVNPEHSIGQVFVEAVGGREFEDSFADYMDRARRGCRSALITVDEFIAGDDSPSCLVCRKKLDAAIERAFGA